MNRHGDRRARIWLTELGWGDSGPRHRFVVGARGQAKRIGRSFRYLRRSRGRLRLRGVVYYSWRDGHPYPPRYKDMWGLHTGLLRVDGSPKPAYRAFRRAVEGLRRSSPAGTGGPRRLGGMRTDSRPARGGPPPSRRSPGGLNRSALRALPRALRQPLHIALPPDAAVRASRRPRSGAGGVHPRRPRCSIRARGHGYSSPWWAGTP